MGLNRTKFCAFCNSDLDIEAGVMIYDKNWYHDACWSSFETQNGVVANDDDNDDDSIRLGIHSTIAHVLDDDDGDD